PSRRAGATSTDGRHGHSRSATPAPAPHGRGGVVAPVADDRLSATGGTPVAMGKSPANRAITGGHPCEVVRRPPEVAASCITVITGDRSLIVLPAVVLLLERPDRHPIVVVPGVHVLRRRLRHGRRVGDRRRTAVGGPAARIRRATGAGAASGVARTRLARNHVAAD